MPWGAKQYDISCAALQNVKSKSAFIVENHCSSTSFLGLGFRNLVGAHSKLFDGSYFSVLFKLVVKDVAIAEA